MALLVGQNSVLASNYLLAASLEAFYYQTGYSAAESGTATKAYLHIADTWTATAAKVCVYNAAYELVGSATFSTIANGWNNANFDSTFAVTQGQTYYIAVLADSGYVQTTNSADGWECRSNTSGSYASPPASIAPTSDTEVNAGEPSVYVDGTVSGSGLSKPILMNYYRNRQRS